MTLARTMTYSEVRTLGGRELPTHLVVVPTDKPEESTRIVYEDIRCDEPIPDDMFSLRSLKQ